MATLRSAFARCCKVLGLDQKSCVALTLLLNSKEELGAILIAMLHAEERGEKWGTTEVCMAAEKIKEIAERKAKQSGCPTDV